MKILIEPKEWDKKVIDKEYYRDIVIWAMSLNIPKENVPELAIEEGNKYILSLTNVNKKDKSLRQIKLYWSLVERVCKYYESITSEKVEKTVFDEIFRLQFFPKYVTVGGELKVLTLFRTSDATMTQMKQLISTLVNQVSKNPDDGEPFAFGLDLASEFDLDVNI